MNSTYVGLPDCATSYGWVDVGRVPNPSPHPACYELGHFLWGLCTVGAEKSKWSFFRLLPKEGKMALLLFYFPLSL